MGGCSSSRPVVQLVGLEHADLGRVGPRDRSQGTAPSQDDSLQAEQRVRTGLPEAFAEGVSKLHLVIAADRFGEYHVQIVVRDMHHGKAAHERGFRLEEIQSAVLIDHGGFVLMAVENADDIVLREKRLQRLALCIAPPVRRAGPVVVESPPDGIPSFRGELVPAVMLEQHDWPAIGSVGGEVVLEPGQPAIAPFLVSPAKRCAWTRWSPPQSHE